MNDHIIFKHDKTTKREKNGLYGMDFNLIFYHLENYGFLSIRTSNYKEALKRS